jgi:Calcineurin-like phosphoesterase
MHRPAIILGLIVLLVGSGSLASAARTTPPPGRSVRPVADSYVASSVPKKNFGKAHALWVSGRPQTRAYLRFDLRGLKDMVVRRATLSLFARNTGRFAVQVASNKWNERAITFRNAPRPGRRIGGPVKAGRILCCGVNVTSAVRAGKQVTFVLTSGGGPIRFDSREGRLSPSLRLTLEPRPATLLAAGDVGFCGQPYDEATGALIKTVPGTVAALGDLAYETGTAAEFATCYQPTWGAFKNRTRPAPGNHEYETAGASGYYGYWGSRAGNPVQGWYSYDLGAWHIIALNSECQFIGGCFVGSPEETWLRADLAAHERFCTLAYWHEPLFSEYQGSSEADKLPFWQALYAARADVVLNGHSHNYQRYALQTPTGAPDPAYGIREFVVGTGGNPNLHPLNVVLPNAEVANNTTWGVLKLTLRNSGYDWQFLRAAGGTFTDSGSQACH